MRNGSVSERPCQQRISFADFGDVVEKLVHQLQSLRNLSTKDAATGFAKLFIRAQIPLNVWMFLPRPECSMMPSDNPDKFFVRHWIVYEHTQSGEPPFDAFVLLPDQVRQFGFVVHLLIFLESRP
jgi:hypothetical protein